MNSLTAGHFEASFSASAVVILRQLLSPKPSARARLISSSPHQGGVPPSLAVSALPSSAPPPAASSPPPPSASVSAAPVLPPPLVVSSPPPHAANPSANKIRATATAVARF